MTALAHPSQLARPHAGSHALALVVALAALALVGFVLAARLGSTSSPPIQSQEPSVTSPTGR
jgi:hypothetical protein